jgi:phosphomannomutase
MLAEIAAHHGAEHVETLTGFKWLARADAGLPGKTLVYAYEEAIGHCVDPGAVRDKDGISAAVLVCDLVATLLRDGRTVPEALDALFRRHGVHATTAVSARFPDGDAAAAAVARLRDAPPDRLAGYPVTIEDLSLRRGQFRTDALILSGGDADTTVRVVVRPSGTEPKLKSYLEVRLAARDDLAAARTEAQRLIGDLIDTVEGWCG